MRRPTIFIVGAPKCGTTALFEWLDRHPQVGMSRPKEPQFFADDILGHQRTVTDMESYLLCFEEPGEAEFFGEASTCYLASASAAEQIRTFSPTAKIIAMVRDPVETMYAMHNERLLNNLEHIRDFASALDSDAPRFWTAGRFRGEQVIRLSYRRMVQFAEQVQCYIQVFGRENVHVIVYDDLLASAQEVYKNTLDFLGLEDDQREDFAKVNANRRVRSIAMHGFVKDSGGSVQHIVRHMLPKPVRASISSIVNQFNVVEEPRPKMDSSLRRRLVKECFREIDALSELLHRDLSSWKRV